MTLIGWFQILLYCAIVVALVKPLGWYMTRVFNGERTFLSPVLRPVETALYRIGGVDEKREQHWLTYTVAMLLFHVGGFLIIYGLMRLQDKIDRMTIAKKPTEVRLDDVKNDPRIARAAKEEMERIGMKI